MNGVEEIESLRSEVKALRAEVKDLKEFIKTMYSMLSEEEEECFYSDFPNGPELGRYNT